MKLYQLNDALIKMAGRTRWRFSSYCGEKTFVVMIISSFMISMISLSLLITITVLAAKTKAQIEDDIASGALSGVIAKAIPVELIQDIINESLTSFASTYFGASTLMTSRSITSGATTNLLNCSCVPQVAWDACKVFDSCVRTRNATVCTEFYRNQRGFCDLFSIQ